MVYPHVSFRFSHRLVNLQTVEIEVAIGHIKRVWTVLLFIPNLFHAEDQPVKSGEAAIVVRASRHMSDCFHNMLSFSSVFIYSNHTSTQAYGALECYSLGRTVTYIEAHKPDAKWYFLLKISDYVTLSAQRKCHPYVEYSTSTSIALHYRIQGYSRYPSL